MKKLVGLILTAALLMTLAAGMAVSEGVQLSEPGVMPIVPNYGDVKLRFLVTDHPAIIDWATNDFITWMNEQTNVEISFDTVPLEGRAEKVNLILASADYPDVFYGLAITGPMISKYGVQEGLFLPLNDLIDKWGVETKQIFEEFPGSKGLITQLDGNIYSMPTVNECYHCTIANKFWMNQKWLDNLGLEKPKTLDELYEVLVAFRDNDANGNGDPNDEIPMAGAYLDGWNTQTERFIMNAFTFYPLDLTATATTAADAFGLYLDDSGKVTVPFYQPELKDALKFMAKLNDEGLFYAGSYTQNLDQLIQLTENGLIGSTSAGYIQFAEMASDAYRSYTYVTPVTGPNGYANVYTYPHDAVYANGFVLSKDCANPDAAIKWADFVYTYEASMRNYYGVKDVDWIDNPEGLLGINGLPAKYKVLTPWQEATPQNKHVVQQSINKRDAAWRFGESSDPDVDLYSNEGLETLLYQVTKEYEPFTHNENVLPPVKFTDVENNDMAIIKNELASAIKEGMVAFMTSVRDVDTEYDAWVEDLKAKGLDTLIEYYQKAYDAQYK